MNSPTLLWLHRDLRLRDNAALQAAGKAGPVLPVYIFDTGSRMRPLGGAAAWWLGESLKALEADITAAGGRLLILEGRTEDLLPRLARLLDASGVYWNAGREPGALVLEAAVRKELEKAGIPARAYAPNSLHIPGSVTKDDGTAYRVYGAFRRAATALPPPPAPPTNSKTAYWAEPVPDEMAGHSAAPRKAPAWSRGMAAEWTPGEAGADERLKTFVDEHMTAYGRNRDRPDLDTTSRFSPHLAFGEISVQRVWHACSGKGGPGSGTFLNELIWRDFAHHTLMDRPDMATEPLQPAFKQFPWRQDAEALGNWKEGHTGYPIIDAAMRALWQTGWMHNRLRMVVASFLIKDLGIHWREGEAWFWDTLVDADPASNTFNWQWVAGCGYDAAPFFRIFNPTRQSEKFDPKGDYIRRFVPELGELVKKDIHQPDEAPTLSLRVAGVELGRDYPHPIVDHAEAREWALSALEQIKSK